MLPDAAGVRLLHPNESFETISKYQAKINGQMETELLDTAEDEGESRGQKRPASTEDEMDDLPSSKKQELEQN